MTTRALILAAGRGERMRPLTDATPKPLLMLKGRPLIAWHLEALAAAGVHEVVVNTAWLEEQFPAALGDGSRWGLAIHYSMEGRDHGGALETGGGLKKALPLLGDCFWLVSGDAHLPDFRFDPAIVEDFRASAEWGRIWLVDNPPHHRGGDFGIGPDGLASEHAPRLTWSSLGLFKAEFAQQLMGDLAPGEKAPVARYLRTAIGQRRLGAVHYRGRWTDVGTPERLGALQSS